MTIIFFYIALFLLPSIILFFLFKGTAKKHGSIKDGIKKIYGNEEENEKHFIKCVKKNINFINFITGEASLNIFTKNVVDELKKTKKTTEAIAGPVIMVDDDRVAYLVEAVKEGKIKLYRSDNRHKIHFRVGEHHLYIEWPHMPLASERKFTEVEEIPFEIKRYQKLFNTFKNKAKLSENVEKDFIFLNGEDLKKSKYGEDENFNIDTFKEKLKEMKIPYHYSK